MHFVCYVLTSTVLYQNAKDINSQSEVAGSRQEEDSVDTKAELMLLEDKL